jgi:hypothetical protein
MLSCYNDSNSIESSHLPSLIYEAFKRCSLKPIRIQVKKPTTLISPEFQPKYAQNESRNQRKPNNINFSSRFLKSISESRHLYGMDEGIKLLKQSAHLSKIAILHENSQRNRNRIATFIKSKKPVFNDKDELKNLSEERIKLTSNDISLLSPYTAQYKERHKIRLQKMHYKHILDWKRLKIHQYSPMHSKITLKGLSQANSLVIDSK